MDSGLALYQFAQQYLPGGVSASARANVALGRPFYVSRGDGPYVFDLEGRRYVDMCTSHGASLLGHNHPQIKSAISQALELGVICAYETVHHSALAQRVTQIIPCAEMVRYAGSGTETVMHALRLARAATGRSKLLKFEGHFHGYSDYVYFSSDPPLDQAGPASAPVPYPQSAGIPASMADLIVVVPFNDPPALEQAFAEHGTEIAALVMEPINYDQGCIVPQPGFLQLCRDLCDRHGALLFFDEVLTAFRVALGGAQEYYGIVPDLCVLGKAFGGGTPISAIAGKKEVMEHLRPVGQSEHSGTYIAHLTTVLAAQAALAEYSRPGFYEQLDSLGEPFYGQFRSLIDRSGLPIQLQYVGPRFGIYFGIEQPVTNYRQAAVQNREMLYQFIGSCIRRGMYMHVSPHHGFSAAHTPEDLDRALEALEGALGDVRRKWPHKQGNDGGVQG